MTRSNTRNKTKKTTKRHSAARRGGAQPSKCRGAGKLAGIMLASTSLIGGGIYAAIAMQEEKPDALGCYARDDQHQHAVLLDRSMTGLSEAQLRDTANGLEQVYEAAPANALISIFTTASDASGSIAKPVFEMCRPADTAAEIAALGLDEKPQAYLDRRKNEARKQLESAVGEIVTQMGNETNTASDSPILEQIRSVSRYPAFAKAQSRDLTVITDGIQNSHMAQFCVVQGQMPAFATFAQRPDYDLSIKPDSLDGGSVNLMLMEFNRLPSPVLPYCTSHELRQWWVDYFEGNGADKVTLNNLRYWSAP